MTARGHPPSSDRGWRQPHSNTHQQRAADGGLEAALSGQPVVSLLLSEPPLSSGRRLTSDGTEQTA